MQVAKRAFQIIGGALVVDDSHFGTSGRPCRRSCLLKRVTQDRHLVLDERILMSFWPLDGIDENTVPSEHDSPGLAQPSAAKFLRRGSAADHTGADIVAGSHFAILVILVFPSPVIEIEQDGFVVKSKGIEDGKRAARAGRSQALVIANRPIHEIQLL